MNKRGIEGQEGATAYQPHQQQPQQPPQQRRVTAAAATPPEGFSAHPPRVLAAPAPPTQQSVYEQVAESMASGLQYHSLPGYS